MRPVAPETSSAEVAGCRSVPAVLPDSLAAPSSAGCSERLIAQETRLNTAGTAADPENTDSNEYTAAGGTGALHFEGRAAAGSHLVMLVRSRCRAVAFAAAAAAVGTAAAARLNPSCAAG